MRPLFLAFCSQKKLTNLALKFELQLKGMPSTCWEAFGGRESLGGVPVEELEKGAHAASDSGRVYVVLIGRCSGLCHF